MPAAADVVILGSGAAGLSAALSASEGGAEVIVLERSAWAGGTTAISGGVVWAPGNHLMTEAGIPDSDADAITYLDRIDRGGDSLLRTEFVHNASRVMKLLEERTPLTWALLPTWPDYHSEEPGGSEGGRSMWPAPIHVPADIAARVQPSPETGQTLSDPANSDPASSDPANSDPANDGVVFKGPVRGRALVGALLMELGSRHVEIRLNTRARHVVVENGRVTGVTVDGEHMIGHVVLATGGFQHDRELSGAFLRAPEIVAMGPPGCSGDGLRMAMTAGAMLSNMAEGWWMPAMHADGEDLDGSRFYRPLHSERAQPGALMIDRNGRRFVNEAQNYGDVGRAMQNFSPDDDWFPALPSWLVFDSSLRRSGSFGPLRPSDPDPDWLMSAGSLPELAKRMSVAKDALVSTVERFNANALNATDPDFRRGERHYDRWIAGGSSRQPVLRPLDEAPFYALKVHCGCMGTKGGPKTDSYGRVQAASGGVIAGLYAAGNAAANPFGIATPAGGATIASALVFGTRAGQAAATDR
ncbi:MAG: FAD-dependent oxidoreductase [Acidimicrobiales bacterium]